ncbi:MAG TPA: biopolymer transporter ExbD [Candidatus Paceibacterota bacterium]
MLTLKTLGASLIAIIGLLVIFTGFGEPVKIQVQHVLGAKIASARNILPDYCHEQYVVNLSITGEIQINKQPVKTEDLEERLREIYEEVRCKVIYIDANPSLRYGDVVRIVDTASGIGVTSIMMTDKLRLELGYPPRN